MINWSVKVPILVPITILTHTHTHKHSLVQCGPSLGNPKVQAAGGQSLRPHLSNSANSSPALRCLKPVLSRHSVVLKTRLKGTKDELSNRLETSNSNPGSVRASANQSHPHPPPPSQHAWPQALASLWAPWRAAENMLSESDLGVIMFKIWFSRYAAVCSYIWDAQTCPQLMKHVQGPRLLGQAHCNTSEL